MTEEAFRDGEGKFRDYAEIASDWFREIGPDYKFTLLTENAFGSDPADRIGTACWEHALLGQWHGLRRAEKSTKLCTICCCIRGSDVGVIHEKRG